MGLLYLNMLQEIPNTNLILFSQFQISRMRIQITVFWKTTSRNTIVIKFLEKSPAQFCNTDSDNKLLNKKVGTNIRNQNSEKDVGNRMCRCMVSIPHKMLLGR
jgi:hypothetical protein